MEVTQNKQDWIKVIILSKERNKLVNKKYKPIYIPHYETFDSKEKAVEREKELKATSGRKWLKQLIADGKARQAGGIPFEEKMALLTATLKEQMDKDARTKQRNWYS